VEKCYYLPEQVWMYMIQRSCRVSSNFWWALVTSKKEKCSCLSPRAENQKTTTQAHWLSSISARKEIQW
jgi:hypothetical protein